LLAPLAKSSRRTKRLMLLAQRCPAALRLGASRCGPRPRAASRVEHGVPLKLHALVTGTCLGASRPPALRAGRVQGPGRAGRTRKQGARSGRRAQAALRATCPGIQPEATDGTVAGAGLAGVRLARSGGGGAGRVGGGAPRTALRTPPAARSAAISGSRSRPSAQPRRQPRQSGACLETRSPRTERERCE